MRICLLANNTRVDNGWGRMARELTLALKKAGHEVVVCVEEGGGLSDDAVVLQNSLRFALHRSWRSVLLHFPLLAVNAWKLRRYVRRADVVHALDGYPYGVLAALACAFGKVPFFITVVGTYSFNAFHFPLERALMRMALARAKKIVAISAYTARHVMERVPSIAIDVIGLGVDADWLTVPRQDPYADAPPSPYILTVGAVKPQKGYTVSLTAFAEAKKKYPKLSYVGVGWLQHKHMTEILALARELGVAESVYFFTGLSDRSLMALYDHAEMFVLSSIEIHGNVEGFGIVFREAGARGLASVGSLNCGAEDAVVDGSTGILVPQGDVAAVAGAVLRFMNDPLLRRRMGAAGRQLAASWTWDRVAREYLDLYSPLCNR